MAVNLESHIDLAPVTVGVDQIVVQDNIGNDIGLVERELEEGNSVIVRLGAIHCSNDGIAGKDGEAGVGEDRVTSDGRGSVEVADADEKLDAVVEFEARTHKGRGQVREALRGVKVARGPEDQALGARC